MIEMESLQYPDGRLEVVVTKAPIQVYMHAEVLLNSRYVSYHHGRVWIGEGSTSVGYIIVGLRDQVFDLERIDINPRVPHE